MNTDKKLTLENAAHQVLEEYYRNEIHAYQILRLEPPMSVLEAYNVIRQRNEFGEKISEYRH